MIREDAANVDTREQLVELIQELVVDLSVNTDNWENVDLEAFLTALAAWLADSDGYYANIGLEPQALSAWRLMADALMGAGVYE